MRTTKLYAHLPAGSPAEVFDQLIRYDRYADLVEPVRYITIEDATEDQMTTHWSVTFRKGVLNWKEREQLDRENHVIRFSQLEGDFDVMEGAFVITEAGDGVDVNFHCTFDFGVASIESIVEPIAARVLRENMALVLKGLLGDKLVVPEQQPEAVTPVKHAVFDMGDARDIPGLAVASTAKGTI